jgi:hypothetical protein
MLKHATNHTQTQAATIWEMTKYIQILLIPFTLSACGQNATENGNTRKCEWKAGIHCKEKSLLNNHIRISIQIADESFELIFTKNKQNCDFWF